MSEEEMYDEELGEEEDLPPELSMDDAEEAQRLEAELDEAGAEEGGEEQQEEEEKIPDLPLTEEMVAENLSLLSRIGDGLAHAYIKLDLREKEVTDASILNRYIHLRFIDMSRNHLKDISALSSITHLLTLRADNNALTNAKLDDLPYLQFASFSKNKIQSTEGMNHPMLEHLCLSFNEITAVSGLDPSRLAHLHTLELRGNKLQTTKGICLPQLKNLFLAGNIIKNLEDIHTLTNLCTLHLRDNQLETLDGFADTMVNLEYINMRGNNISNVEEVKKLDVLPKLKALALSENPASEDDEYRFEVIVDLERVVRLDKDEVTDEERAEAAELRKQKLADLEAKKAEEEGMDQSQAPDDVAAPED